MRLNFIKYQKDDSISRSLIRFFRYCTGYEFDCIIPGQFIKNKNLISFALIDQNDQDQVCQMIYDTKIPLVKVRILGYNDFCDVNLIKLQTLKQQLEQSLKINQADDHRYLPVFKERIKIFFKGHGEQSLLGCIGWVIYYFENYSRLLNSKDYSPQGVYNHFLLPGIGNWNEFKRRFEKYAAVIYMGGWPKLAKRIESLNNIVSSRLESLIVLKKISAFDEEILNAISEIRTILEDIEKQIQPNNG